MFEQDYIIRLIREMIRTLLKLLFNIDSVNPVVELLDDEEQASSLNVLLDMVDEGRICEAENRILERLNPKDKRQLENALLFYSYLNDKEEAFLKAHNFSREEIKSGIEAAASRYGLSGITDIFML